MNAIFQPPMTELDKALSALACIKRNAECAYERCLEAERARRAEWERAGRPDGAIAMSVLYLSGRTHAAWDALQSIEANLTYCRITALA